MVLGRTTTVSDQDIMQASSDVPWSELLGASTDLLRGGEATPGTGDGSLSCNFSAWYPRFFRASPHYPPHPSRSSACTRFCFWSQRVRDLLPAEPRIPAPRPRRCGCLLRPSHPPTAHHRVPHHLAGRRLREVSAASPPLPSWVRPSLVGCRSAFHSAWQRSWYHAPMYHCHSAWHQLVLAASRRRRVLASSLSLLFLSTLRP